METFQLLIDITLVGGAALIFFFRKWLVAKLVASAQHGYDEKLEGLKDDLQRKSSEIEALRSGALVAVRERQITQSQKSAESYELLWKSACDYSKLGIPAMFRRLVKLEEMEANIADPKLQKFAELLRGAERDLASLVTKSETRIYIKNEIWEKYQSYCQVYLFVYSEFDALSKGAGITGLIEWDDVIQDYKKALPGYDQYIDQWGVNGIIELQQYLYADILVSIQQELGSDDRADHIVDRVLDINGQIETRLQQQQISIPDELKQEEIPAPVAKD